VRAVVHGVGAALGVDPTEVVDAGNIVENGPENALAEAIVGLTEDLNVAPNRHTIEGRQAALYEVPFLHGDAGFWGILVALPKVPVPAPPLDGSDPGYSHVSRHGEEVLVVPVCRPDCRPGLRLGALQNDGKEDADDNNTVGGEEVKVGKGGRGDLRAMVCDERSESRKRLG